MGSFGLVSPPETLPYCLFKNQGLKTLGHFRTSMQSTQQLLLYTLWSQTHTCFWALFQLRQNCLPAWTSRTHFSASTWPHRANPSLPSNGNVLKGQLTWTWLPQDFKNSPNYLWDCLSIGPKGFLSQPAWLHTPLVCR
jgi:hypothetical protein